MLKDATTKSADNITVTHLSAFVLEDFKMVTSLGYITAI